MVNLKKYPILRIKNFLNLGSQQFYKISNVLQCAHVVPRDTKNKLFISVIILIEINLISNIIQSDKSKVSNL